jgi:hypothetical protein
MVLLDFEQDATYTGLEVQRLADPDGMGEGTVVLMARRDGRTDVYFEPHLQLDPAGYGWVAQGLAGWYPTAMPASEFEVTADGLQLTVQLELCDGRSFDLRVHERRPGAGRRFTLLAPVGHASANPTFLPVFWLPNMAFVRRKGTNVDLRIGGDRRPLTRAPVPWKRARYCAAPALGFWNEEHAGAAVVLPRAPGEHRVPGGTASLVEHDGQVAVRTLTARCGTRWLAVVHDPPVCELDTLADGAVHTGRVTVTVDDAELFGGCYRIRRIGDRVDLAVDVTRPWQPRDQSTIGAVMFRVLVFFRTWPTTYRWRGSVDLAPDVPVLTSRWERTRR